MSYQKAEHYFLLALIAGVSILILFIFQPFLYALILAVIFTTVFGPLHKKVLSVMRGARGISALVTTVFVLVIIVAPVVFLSMQIFKEATQLYSSLASNGGVPSISGSMEKVLGSLGLSSFPLSTLDLGQYMKTSLSWLIGHLDSVFSSIAKIIVNIFILLLALYYLFKDGDNLKRAIVALSPLQDIYDETIFRKLELAVNSVVRGNIFVGLVQGIMTAIGLAIFGVQNPILWGSVAAIAALVPGFGTSLVLIPSILFLFFSGDTAAAVGLFIWWITAVGLVDNVLGPRLVSRGVSLHPFLILLSIIGGIGFFGPLGFLFGPLVLSLTLALLEIYSSINKKLNN